MGKTADECLLQMRMLNRGKGPAVYSLRAQIDRLKYSRVMKNKLELQNNLYLKQAEIISLERDLNTNFWILTSRNNIKYSCKAVVVSTGTYLNGKIHVGETSYDSGPDGMFPSMYLANSLEKLGIIFKRFKTGTPARVLKSSLNLDKFQIQYGDDSICHFSYSNRNTCNNKAVCYIGHTNLKTKNIILENIQRSPLFTGQIDGTGPRYCPSIEDKIIRFPNNPQHQFFVEPCGENTQEMYLQGLSSSLPEDVQEKFYKSIEGLENVHIMRPAYAIEYDCIDPIQLKSTLEFANVNNLYGAGQFNGSSGYEEAAAQGLIAGINAALKIQGKPPLALDRSTSYIGTLIDDLTTKGVTDPYRMLTSRCEYRLILRQDNADERLTPVGRDIGLVDDDSWDYFLNRKKTKDMEIKRISFTKIRPTDSVNKIIVSRGTSQIAESVKVIDLLKRSQISYKDLSEMGYGSPDLNCSSDILEKIEVEIKYAGYIERQKKQIQKMKNLENKKIPENICYDQINNLSMEAREKLAKIKPENLGQASRISGVSPADISVLMIWISSLKWKKR